MSRRTIRKLILNSIQFGGILAFLFRVFMYSKMKFQILMSNQQKRKTGK